MDIKSIKIILLISLLVNFTIIGQQITNADYYFDGINGSDSNNGLTPAAAWKTLNKFNSLGSLITNKTVAFRDSIDYRRTDGTTGDPSLYLTASGVRLTNWYGPDSYKLPRIIGSTKITGWVSDGSNIWHANANISPSIWFEFADSTRWGVPQASQSLLTKEFDFFCSGGVTYIYSPSDPSTRYISVEDDFHDNGLILVTNNNLIDHLEFRYHWGNGMKTGRNLIGNVITYCAASFNGTTNLGNSGNGFQSWTGNITFSHNYAEANSSHAIHIFSLYSGDVLDNIIVEYNHIYNEFHTGIDFNLQDGSICRNSFIRYNIIHNDNDNPFSSLYGAGFFFNASGGSTVELIVSYNLVYRTTIDAQTSGGSYGAQILNGAVVIFDNNTFYHCGSNIISIESGSQVTLRNNILHNIYSGVTRGLINGTPVAQSGNLGYGSYNNFNGMQGDPNFTSLATGSENFRLQLSSPAIDLGTPLGYTVDLDGNPIVGNPDAGNYESSSTTVFQLTVSIHDGWNMVSIPGLHPVDQDVNTWWPGKVGDVFKFFGDYQAITTAVPGEGYWIKNAGAQIYNTGDEWPSGGIQIASHNPINATAGWNMIGCYESTAAVNGITTTPPGLINSPAYGYSGGYQAANYLIPGYGYWINLSGDGLINLQPAPLGKGSSEVVEYFKDEWGKIIITDYTGRSYTLYAVTDDVNFKAGQSGLHNYELPPVPPAGMFDIRFGTGKIAEDISSTSQLIEMTGIKYPITVKVENINIRLYDETRNKINVIVNSGNEIIISDVTINSLLVLER